MTNEIPFHKHIVVNAFERVESQLVNINLASNPWFKIRTRGEASEVEDQAPVFRVIFLQFYVA